jgi:hypothetical protein
MSTFSDFLNEHGVKPADIAARSAAIETLTTDDRARRVKRAAARRVKKSYDESSAEKPERLGRGVTVRTIDQAVSGAPIPRTGRKKILRAVNSIMTSQKKDAVELAHLFGDVGPRTGKKK